MTWAIGHRKAILGGKETPLQARSGEWQSPAAQSRDGEFLLAHSIHTKIGRIKVIL
jgi:hypothetical protein